MTENDKITALIAGLRQKLGADLPADHERATLWGDLNHAGRRFLCAAANIDESAALNPWAALPAAYRSRLFGAMARLADWCEQFRRITKPQPVAIVAQAVFISDDKEKAA